MHRPSLTVLLIALLLPACSSSQERDLVDPSERYGITASNAFFYYEDLEGAADFYTGTLGLRLAADYGSAKILQVASTSYLTLVDAEEGMHGADEPKTAAIALITDQLDGWYAYLRDTGVAMRYDYDPVEGRPHHGFVVEDPEGYYLEFERFNEHPENRRLTPLLEQLETLPVSSGQAPLPPDLGFKATVLWLYYRDCDAIRDFYSRTLGLEEVVDQGWAWVHRASPSGFIGPVDEERGMHDWTEERAVTVSFITGDLEGWFDHLERTDALELRHDTIQEDEQGRYRAFVGYDPEGYYLEFDTFLPHPLNTSLLEALGH